MAGCGGPVEVEPADPSGADLRACEAFMADLPDTLADEDRRETDPDSDLTAAYGDPAITVRCGVGVPDGFDQASSCEVAEGVGWYLPPEQVDDPQADVTLTTPGFQPIVELRMPGDYRPNGVAAALAQLGPPVTEHLRLTEECD